VVKSSSRKSSSGSKSSSSSSKSASAASAKPVVVAPTYTPVAAAVAAPVETAALAAAAVPSKAAAVAPAAAAPTAGSKHHKMAPAVTQPTIHKGDAEAAWQARPRVPSRLLPTYVNYMVLGEWVGTALGVFWLCLLVRAGHVSQLLSGESRTCSSMLHEAVPTSP
jgi:hypothetical protein